MLSQLKAKAGSSKGQLRQFGNNLVGKVRWGTHLCQFYESKQDLLDILVPYFAQGLRANELCMWITSPPLEVAEAKEALSKAVPDLQYYIQKGQLEILPYPEWYLLRGSFSGERVLEGWVAKETAALKNGFEGLRLTGNTFWVERALWGGFADYEAAVNAVVGKHRMIALCTYCLPHCSGADVVDVIHNHGGALIKQKGSWILVEDSIKRQKQEKKLFLLNGQLEKRVNQRTRQIESERKRLFDVLETLPQMVCLFTAHHYVAFANRSFRNKFGESKGRHCYQYCFGKSEPCDFCETYTVLRTGKPHKWEVNCPDGSVIQAYDFPFRDVDGSDKILEMDIDVTLQRQNEAELARHREHLQDLVTERTEQLEQTRRKLEENAVQLEEYASRMEELAKQRLEQLKDSERLAAIGATAGMVGHDIRNPLQAITGDLYLAKIELQGLPETMQKDNAIQSMDEIEKNVDYINKIVADLQDYARPLKPTAKEVDIHGIVNEVLGRNSIPVDVQVQVNVDPEATTLTADPDMLNRIIGNLVTNAVQAMPNGGKITIGTHYKGNSVILEVQDTGVGIPTEVKDKLFTPLFTTKSKGQGFGLAVVKRMTEALGGTVNFKSELGKGTTFTVRLPIKK